MTRLFIAAMLLAGAAFGQGRPSPVCDRFTQFLLTSDIFTDDEIQACVTHINQHYETAARTLAELHGSDHSRPSALSVHVALASQFGGACGQEFFEYPQWAVFHATIPACIAEMRSKRPAAWKVFTGKVPFVELDGFMNDAGISAELPMTTWEKDILQNIQIALSVEPKPVYEPPAEPSAPAITSAPQPQEWQQPAPVYTPAPAPSSRGRVFSGVQSILVLAVLLLLVVPAIAICAKLAPVLKWSYLKLIWAYLWLLQVSLTDDSAVRKQLTRWLVRLLPISDRPRGGSDV